MILEGVGVSGGQAVGRLVLLSRVHDDANLPETPVSLDEALTRLTDAIAASRDEIAVIAAAARERIGADSAAIIEAQLLVLDDPEWYDPIVDDIRGGLAPETAVWQTSEDVAAVLSALDDAYLRERASDILDVAQRVVGHLTGRSRSAELSDLTGDVIIGAYELTPTDTLNLDLDVVRGIITEVGARTSHAAIIARQLGIPAVVAASGLMTSASPGVLVIVDGDRGECSFNPEQHDVDAARAAASARGATVVITEQVTTRDGVAVSVLANASSPQDVERAVAAGADGIGLFRTEFLYMQSDDLPDEARQVEFYGAVAAAAEGRPVTFRTLDVGGDKPLPGLPMPHEENPFLGVRGVRLTLQHAEVFATQLRALATTAERYPGISVMVPMISGLEEIDDVRAMLAEVVPNANFRFGTMVEVPSTALLIRELIDEVDFLSVGTNDLTAYLLAADRGNRELQYLYTEFHPAVVRVLAQIRQDAGTTPVSVCGEVAGDPRSLALLVGLGYQQLSVAGPLVPGIKQRIRGLDATLVRPAVEALLRASRHRHIEAALLELGRLETDRS